MDTSSVTQLGVSGVIVVLLLFFISKLWEENRELRQQSHADQAAMLPALTAASEAMREMARVAAQVSARLDRRD